ncbi:MAG TPA: DUF1015 domain-containing protein [Phycisphaerae bacterium]|nr:DUF1015 domain-containing protein [Phycisphaerae bacterium]
MDEVTSGIAPLAGIRYDVRRFGKDLSKLIAPPYDVLDGTDKDALLKGHPRNIVAVDLPHVPPKQAGPDAVYQRAADTFEAWLGDGVLIRDPQPGIYLYQQRYEHGGREYTRTALFARLRLSPPDEGRVVPHEQTFGGPKEDRLRLMRATRCNLSAVFGLYSDPNGEVLAALAPVGRDPDAIAMLNGVESRLWYVPDGSVVARACQALAGKPIYIADGHHRYETALMYRDWLSAREGELPEDHPARYALVGLCAMEDDGLLMLPYHRVVEHVPGLDLGELVSAAAPYFRAGEAPTIEPGPLAEAVARHPTGSVAVVQPSTGRGIMLVLERDDVLDSLVPQHGEAWRRLGVAILHRFLIDRVIAPSAGGQPAISYTSLAEQAVEAAAQSDGVALLVQPTQMAQMRAVCRTGDLMPQKSTFFYPKLATGLVINPLY